MELPGVDTLSADSLRWYVRERRDLLGYTQESFAAEITMPYPTYRDFEGGSTREMKSNNLTKVIDRLGIPLAHIRRLADPGITQCEAEKLAAEELEIRADAVAARITTPAAKSDMVEFVRKFKADPVAPAELIKLINEGGTPQQ